LGDNGWIKEISNKDLHTLIIQLTELMNFSIFFAWCDWHVGRELRRAGAGFHKNDNAFLAVAVDDVAVLQAAADRQGTTLV
jgi:hypothetical protein